MRTVFHEQLDTLNENVAGLCERAAVMMQLATVALLNADLEASERVIDRRDDIDRQCAALESDTFTLLARQAPVASDLRVVLSGMRNVADLQRMGALAAHVARISRLRHPNIAVPGEVCGYFAEMGRIAVQLAQDTKGVVLQGDPDAAARLNVDDEAMDDIHRQLFAVVMNPEWPHGTTAAVDVTLLSRYYERFADHAVEIAHNVTYRSTGARRG
ncbi:phosphate signaling complex protein PhoU [Mycolicibacterium sp. lyk4-40-TYG-92]|uniref:phosphate signaling complex protein PhoU n=1 Tax=Mycolicibacterium sp. lyk4-40-TYG-92 TaxID=3040295 RepID=UPI00254BC15A|nr:phosphate signaling complex protein PhoU [Mycolicibacterium sp. lyk4-40-TYG-92]